MRKNSEQAKGRQEQRDDRVRSGQNSHRAKWSDLSLQTLIQKGKIINGKSRIEGKEGFPKLAGDAGDIARRTNSERQTGIRPLCVGKVGIVLRAKTQGADA